ncbi:MAG TPA: hypothetical protein VEB59_08765 [Gemmatimonadales bacterium]|nr:hypothetical protein [Gemmatimonadales bacterium]
MAPRRWPRFSHAAPDARQDVTIAAADSGHAEEAAASYLVFSTT